MCLSEGVTGQGDAPEVPGRVGRAPLAANDKIEITKGLGAVFSKTSVARTIFCLHLPIASRQIS